MWCKHQAVFQHTLVRSTSRHVLTRAQVTSLSNIYSLSNWSIQTYTAPRWTRDSCSPEILLVMTWPRCKKESCYAEEHCEIHAHHVRTTR